MNHQQWYRKGFRYLVFDGGERLYCHTQAEARAAVRACAGKVVWRIGRDGKATKATSPQRRGKHHKRRNPALCDPGPLIQGRSKSGPESVVMLPDQNRVKTTWEIVPLKSLVFSNEAVDGSKNKKYPVEYQPRDRSLPAYREQHMQLVKNFDPALLMWSATAQQGSPIIAKKGQQYIVASGNGRSMALAEIYTQAKHKGKAAKYQTEMKRWADLLGVSFPKVVSNPVLIRVLPPNIDGPAFARDANVSVIAEYNATEQAIADANELTPEIVGLFKPFNNKGNAAGIEALINRPFWFAFIEHVSGPNTENEILAKDRKPSEHGLERMRNALFRYAYGAAVDPLLFRLAESPVKGVSAMLTGMSVAAPAWIDFSLAVKEDQIPPEYDLRSALVGGVFRAIEARRNKIKPIDAAFQTELGQTGLSVESFWMRSMYLAKPDRLAPEALVAVAYLYTSAVMEESLGQLDEEGNRPNRAKKAFRAQQVGMFDLFGTADVAEFSLKLSPLDMLGRAAADGLFNLPYEERSGEGRAKRVRLNPRPKQADIPVCLGSCFPEISRFWSLEWRQWAIEWYDAHFAPAGGRLDARFDAAVAAATYFFPAGNESAAWAKYVKTGILPRGAPGKARPSKKKK